MTKHVLLVFTNPTEGNEEQYNDSYNNVHLAEVLTTDGFVRAQRFKVSDILPAITEHKYLAIYEIENTEPEDAMKALRGLSGNFTMTEAIDLKSSKMTLASQASELLEAI